jgi:alkane 1-monooxygenase
MGFLLSFLVPGFVIASVWMGPRIGYPNALLWLPFAMAYVVVPTVDAVWYRMIWRRLRSRSFGSAAASSGWAVYYRVLPLLSVPIQLVMLAAATSAFALSPLSGAGRGLLALTTGIFSAMFAITVAHELIHRRERLDRFLGAVLLSTVSFGTFKVVHLQIHHPYVGTDLDFATARRGQSIYSFWRQAFIGNFPGALRCERQRLARSGRSLWASDLLAWSTVTLLWLAIAFAWWGWAGGLFFLVQSIVAIMYLDVINYLQHYGLTRRLLPGGRPEPVADHHSWAQGLLLDDLILLNLPRHSNHHVQPQLPFQLLSAAENAPRYPLPYGLMTLVVLVPALFRRIAHRRLDRFEAASAASAANRTMAGRA